MAVLFERDILTKIFPLSGASPAAPASPELPDYTPLKKRRLAEYTNDSSEDVIASIAGDSAVSDKIKSLPNGLKKRLISNLVIFSTLQLKNYTGVQLYNF